MGLFVIVVSLFSGVGGKDHGEEEGLFVGVQVHFTVALFQTIFRTDTTLRNYSTTSNKPTSPTSFQHYGFMKRHGVRRPCSTPLETTRFRRRLVLVDLNPATGSSVARQPKGAHQLKQPLQQLKRNILLFFDEIFSQLIFSTSSQTLPSQSSILPVKPVSLVPFTPSVTPFYHSHAFDSFVLLPSCKRTTVSTPSAAEQLERKNVILHSSTHKVTQSIRQLVFANHRTIHLPLCPDTLCYLAVSTEKPKVTPWFHPKEERHSDSPSLFRVFVVPVLLNELCIANVVIF